MRNKLIPALFTGLTLAAPLAATADILEDSGGKTGRYLLIENNGNVSRQLHMSEVEAFLWGITPAAGYDNANDQALSGSGASATIASGPLQHGTLGALLDGSPQSGAATFSLNPGVGNGVLVDLGAEMELGEVRLWQRADGCCQDRLSNVSVSLWDDNGGSPGNEVFSGVIPGQLPTNSNGSVDLSSKTVRPGGAGAIGTDTMEGAYISGIRATTTGTADPSQFFHIGEIEAFVAGQPRAAGPGIDPANDVARAALGATAGTYDGTTQHGIDGALIDGAEQTGASTWSRVSAGGNAGAYVDLGMSYSVDEVRLHQRNDSCCQDRLSNVTVDFISSGGTVLSSQSFPGTAPTNGFASFDPGDVFSLDSDDILQIELDNTLSDLLRIGAAGDGSLLIGDNVTLDLVSLGNPFALPRGTMFDIFDAGSVTGQFSQINFPAGAQFWDTSALYTSGQLIANVPEPSRAILLLAGLAFSLTRRRR